MGCHLAAPQRSAGRSPIRRSPTGPGVVNAINGDARAAGATSRRGRGSTRNRHEFMDEHAQRDHRLHPRRRAVAALAQSLCVQPLSRHPHGAGPDASDRREARSCASVLTRTFPARTGAPEPAMDRLRHGSSPVVAGGDACRSIEALGAAQTARAPSERAAVRQSAARARTPCTSPPTGCRASPSVRAGERIRMRVGPECTRLGEDHVLIDDVVYRSSDLSSDRARLV